MSMHETTLAANTCIAGTGSPTSHESAGVVAARAEEYELWIAQLTNAQRDVVTHWSIKSTNCIRWYCEAVFVVTGICDLIEDQWKTSSQLPPQQFLRMLYTSPSVTDPVQPSEDIRRPFLLMEKFMALEIADRDALMRISHTRELIQALVHQEADPVALPLVPHPMYNGLIRSFYRDPYSGSAVDMFKRYLNEKENSIQSGEKALYGRSSVIVQSSGMGKSRMILELGNSHDHYVFAFCLRRLDTQGGNGFPPGDINIRTLLINAPRPATQLRYLYACFMRAYFVSAIEYLDPVPDFKPSQKPRHKLWQNLSTPDWTGSEPELQPRLQDWTVSVRQQFLANIIEQTNRYLEWGQPYTAVLYRAKVAAEGLAELLPTDAFFVVAMDEASQLHHGLKDQQSEPDSASICIRRFWMELAQPRFWLVLVDTNSAIESLAPSVETSHRINIGKLESVDPFIHFPPHVLLKPPEKEPKAILQQTPLQHADLKYLVRVGRPLWHSQDITCDNQIGHVQIKIMSTNQLTEHNICDAMLALLAQRVILQFRSDDPAIRPFVERQIQRHLRRVLEYERKPVRLITDTLTEPIPSLVAGALLRESREADDEVGISWGNAVARLRQANSKAQAPLDVGACGELTAQIILCMAFDRADRADTRAVADHDPRTTRLVGQTFVSVRSFLESLVGKAALSGSIGEYLVAQLGHGYIRFTRFREMPAGTPLQPAITEADVFKAWHWGVAWVGRPTQPAWDLIIPVYLGDLNCAFDLSKFTVIAIQVKNRQKEVSSEWLKLLETDLIKRPTGKRTVAHCNLWLELHASHDKSGVQIMGNSRYDSRHSTRNAKTVKVDQPQAFQVVCRGVSSFACTEGVKPGDLESLLSQNSAWGRKTDDEDW